MMTLAVAAVSVVLWRSDYTLVNADTSNSTVPIGNLKGPTLTSSEIGAIRYREIPVSLPDAGETTCHRSSSSGYTTCVVNSLPGFPSP